MSQNNSVHPIRPLRVMFLFTSMPVGGAETLVANMVERFNRVYFSPEICCLKSLGPLGEQLAVKIPATWGFLGSKYDLRVLPRLIRCLRQREVDAVVTVGAGDKMFWGRIAARAAGTPVVLSALHSTGWPDGLGVLNRQLTRITDAFIAVAPDHARFLVEQEGLPRAKVHMIPNGVDTDRFTFDPTAPASVRAELGLPADTRLCGVVAAMRPEKNHRMLIDVAKLLQDRDENVHVLIIGDGPERETIENFSRQVRVNERIHFLGSRSDIPRLLSAMNVFALTSHNEANPVSILEALSVQIPVVATRVGSVPASVQPGHTGYLVDCDDAAGMAEHIQRILGDPQLAHDLGRHGRQFVQQHASLAQMVRGYENLIADIYNRKNSGNGGVPVSNTRERYEFGTPPLPDGCVPTSRQPVEATS